MIDFFIVSSFGCAQDKCYAFGLLFYCLASQSFRWSVRDAQRK